MNNFYTLIKQAGYGKMPATAYDTAWIARLGQIDFEISSLALGWIAEHQLPDGSWGTLTPYYFHDRMICTLAALTALVRIGRRASDRSRIEKGLIALDQLTEESTSRLTNEANGATVGFELLVPSLIGEAESLGINVTRLKDRVLDQLQHKRVKKLNALKGVKVNRFFTTAHSSEMAGMDMQTLLDIDNLQEANGSIGHSPSATAYYVLNVHQDDEMALCYLHQMMTPDGGAPNVAPFDVFERAWILWNLSLTGPISPELLAVCQPHIDFLERSWIPGKGIGWAAGFTPKDSDDSGLVFDVLCRFNQKVDLEALLTFEEEDCFRCFELEANRSVSANIHVLGALRQAGYPADHPAVQKIVRFLQQTQLPGGYWLDKWHASPYYASAHAVIVCAGYLPELVTKTVQWLLDTQGESGACGFSSPTAEETAYCLQALCIWRNHKNDVPEQSIRKGAIWLEDHSEPPYPAQWIGKCLYLPELVVRSAILSALELAK